MKQLQTVFTILICLFFVHKAHAQDQLQHQADSLQLLLKQSKDYAEKKQLLQSLTNLYEKGGNWQQYEAVVGQMMEIQQETNDQDLLAEAYNKLGISSSYMGKNEEAVGYFQQALEINLAQRNMMNASNSYENMAAAYKDLGQYTLAADCLIQSLEIRKAKNHPRIFNNYMKLAVIQALLKNTKQEDYYLGLAKAEMYKRDSIQPSDKAIFYNQLGDIYEKRELYDSSLLCYNHVVHFSKQIGWNRGIAVGIGNLANVYTTMGLLDSAMFYHNKSLLLSESIDDCIGASEELLFLAELAEQRNYNDSAYIFASRSLQKARICKLRKQESLALQYLAQFFKKQLQFEKANIYLESYYAVRDSITSADVKNHIAALETKYQTKAKEQQIELLTAENEIKNQRISQALLLIGTLVLLVILVLALLYFRRKQATFKQSELQQQLLRSQMNPHFIFNVMSSIQSYLYKNEAQKAADYLSRFAAHSRSVLEFSTKETISLKDEIDMLQHFIELQRAGMDKPFEVSFELDEKIESAFILVPPMLLQPFVENAIKHGLQNLDYQGILSLSFKENDTYIDVRITDNGKGLGATQNQTHNSKALSIFEQRRRGIEHKYKKKLSFSFQNLSETDITIHGVSVYLQLPILSDD